MSPVHGKGDAIGKHDGERSLDCRLDAIRQDPLGWHVLSRTSSCRGRGANRAPDLRTGMSGAILPFGAIVRTAGPAGKSHADHVEYRARHVGASGRRDGGSVTFRKDTGTPNWFRAELPQGTISGGTLPWPFIGPRHRGTATRTKILCPEQEPCAPATAPRSRGTSTRTKIPCPEQEPCAMPTWQ